jgi:serine/threonine protein kinase
VIHRDFNCSNVLLDHNYRARVSDFGMAKVGSNKADGQVVTRVLGTTGYLAPEYDEHAAAISDQLLVMLPFFFFCGSVD